MLAAACQPAIHLRPGPAPMPQRGAMRVVQASDGRTISFDDLIATASRADVVMFGEEHDDPETHFAEFTLLEGIGRLRAHVVVSLEMFERDVQTVLNDYLAGRTNESDFLSKSRPWDRYATDYRPLVLLARAEGWPVIAANIPRPMASLISREGLAALDTMTAGSRALAAHDISCPHDAYYTRFADAMTGHTGVAAPSASDSAQMRMSTDRFYEAQCIKDETMAESIQRAYQRTGAGAIVVHFNGTFHTDYSQGTAERVERRLPNAKRVLITAVPVADINDPPTSDARHRADYVIYTRAEPPK
jgi:uncharacterized iron-regulated protein